MRRISSAVILLLAIAGIAYRAYSINTAYAATLSEIDSLQVLSTIDPSSLTPDQLSASTARLQDLRYQFGRLDAETSLPLGDTLVAALPWAGPRYAAARGLIRIGMLGSDVGLTVTQTGADVLRSTETDPAHSAASTWLDAVAPHADQLATAISDIQMIHAIRGSIDASVLPERVRARLDQLDRMLDRPELNALASVDLSAGMAALGESAPATYLVVFQNPAELRPTGGFPGTMALVTFDRGQLAQYQFFDSHELTDAYLQHRQTVVPQPWPIQRFFPQNGFLLHDALWWPDFPRSAQQFMSMYAETGWPPIDGVIAVQPEVASLLVGVTGPFGVDFEGQPFQITADNMYTQINQARVQDVQTADDLQRHKLFLGLIGKNLIDRLKGANKKSLAEAVPQLEAACARRDIQVYAANPAVEAELDRQHCTGRLLPVDGQPMLAVTYANLALSKTSLDMRPRLSLVTESASEGERQVLLDIDLRNGAIADEDPAYHGFQRWWVEVQLPAGSTLLSDPGPMEDPDAPNGGSYIADLFPDQTGRITVRFSMPDTPALLVRRQPGVRPGDVVVSQSGCAGGFDSQLTSDLTVDLSSLCR